MTYRTLKTDYSLLLLIISAVAFLYYLTFWYLIKSFTGMKILLGAMAEILWFPFWLSMLAIPVLLIIAFKNPINRTDKKYHGSAILWIGTLLLILLHS